MSDGATEFDCEGCGAKVYAFGISAPPGHGFCANCWAIHDLNPEVPAPDGEEFWQVYRILCPWDPKLFHPLNPNPRARWYHKTDTTH